MKGSEIIAKALKDKGIKTVYLFPGGTIAPLLNDLVKIGIDYVCMKHEQGAGFAAIGAAKESNEPQVVLVTSGPGATNLLTCIADAYYDSVPIIAFTGQVGTADINIDKKIRQTGFQETDTIGIFKPVVKDAFILNNKHSIYDKVSAAFDLANSGRKGPVLIDMPMDIQRSEAPNEKNASMEDKPVLQKSEISIDNDSVTYINHCLSKAKRPLIMAGNGIYLSNAVNEFRTFVKALGIPTVLSLPANGVLPKGDANYVGMVGHTGEFFANLALYHSDLLIVIGARLDLRQTGSEVDSFKKSKTIIRVDIDENELNYGRVNVDHKICMDLDHFLSQSVQYFNTIDTDNWKLIINNWKQEFDSRQFYNDDELNVCKVVSYFSQLTNGMDVNVTTGVGTHQQLVARYFDFDYPKRKWQTSSGHGTMGYDIPSIFGALYQNRNQIGLCFVGDGSLMLNIQELASIKEFNLPIIIILLNNNRLGIVSQFQLMNWSEDLSTGKKVNPDFSAIADGFGFNTIKIESGSDLNKIDLSSIDKENLPLFIECKIDSEEDVLPMLLGGQHLNQMHPFNDRVELEIDG